MSSNLNCCSFQSSEHCEELQCHVEEDTAEKWVTKTVKILLVISLGRCDDRMTAGVCAFRVIERGRLKRGFHPHVPMFRWKRTSGIPSGLCCAYMGRATEDRKSWMCGFSKGPWLIARDKERETVQRCVNVDKFVNETITSIVQAVMGAESDQEVKIDQEASMTDVKNTLMGELRSAGVEQRAKRVAHECEYCERSEERAGDAEHLHNGARRILVVQLGPGLWRSWDMWSSGSRCEDNV